MNPFEHQKQQARSLDEFDRWWRGYLYASACHLPQSATEADKLFSNEKKSAKAAWLHLKHKEVNQ